MRHAAFELGGEALRREIRLLAHALATA
jgi:hypothetical protein